MRRDRAELPTSSSPPPMVVTRQSHPPRRICQLLPADLDAFHAQAWAHKPRSAHAAQASYAQAKCSLFTERSSTSGQANLADLQSPAGRQRFGPRGHFAPGAWNSPVAPLLLPGVSCFSTTVWTQNPRLTEPRMQLFVCVHSVSLCLDESVVLFSCQ